MAYAFGDLTKEIDKDNKQNIFGAEGPQGFGLADTTEKAKSAAPVEKQGTTTIGAADAGGTGVAAASPKAPETPAPARGATEQRQQTFDRQAERAEIPASLGRLESGIQGREQELQKASDDYLGKFKQTDYGLAPETVQKATTGDAGALDKVSGLLGRGAPGEIPGAFEAPDVMTPGVQDIQTAGGLEQYLRRQAGPQYTAGEGAFDVSALSRSPEFMQARDELGRREAALGAQADELSTGIGQQASDILAENLSGAQGDVRGQLGDLRFDLNTALEAQRQAKIEELAALQAQSPELAAEAAGDARTNLFSRLAPEDAHLKDLIMGGGDLVDASQYYDVYDDPITKQNVASEQQAYQYNLINDLLGGGGEAFQQQGLSDLSGFDQSAYQQALLNAARGAYQPPAPAPAPPPAPVPGPMPLPAVTAPMAPATSSAYAEGPQALPTQSTTGQLQLPVGTSGASVSSAPIGNALGETAGIGNVIGDPTARAQLEAMGYTFDNYAQAPAQPPIAPSAPAPSDNPAQSGVANLPDTPLPPPPEPGYEDPEDPFGLGSNNMINPYAYAGLTNYLG